MQANKSQEMDVVAEDAEVEISTAPGTTDEAVDENTAKSTTTNLKDRKLSWAKLRRVDSLNLEAGKISSNYDGHHGSKNLGWKTTLSLAFQSIGIIYGDVGTSPLYVYASTFSDGIHNKNDLLGVLSLIIYTIILSPMIKYVCIVLWANDNGNGGTFALYSLICRHAKVSLIPNQQPEDKEVSNYKLDIPSNQLRRAQKVKEKLESSRIAKVILLMFPILGTSMIMGDGTLTPCISGIAVVAVFVITSCLVTLIMLIIWKASIWRIALFFLVFFSLDTIYLTSVLAKFTQGGYLPIAFSFVLMTMMGIWHYVHKERYLFELNNKVSSEYVRDLAKNPQIKRVPGIGLLYSELVQGIPPIFPHFVSNITSVHSVVVLVSIKSIPISKVEMVERFLFRMVEPREYRVFRCVVRYGYNDRIEEPKVFEQQLVEHLKEFIRHEHYILADGSPEQMLELGNIQNSGLLQKDGKSGRSSSSTVHIEESLPQAEPSAPRVSSSSIQSFNAAKSSNSSAQLIAGSTQLVAEEEQQIVQKAMDQGVFYLLGEAEVVAKQDSSFFKKFIVNYAYNFIRKNVRQGEKVMTIPMTRLLRVGMVYEI